MAANNPPSPSPSQLPPVPASPTYSYASTANPLSQFNLPLPPPPRPAHAFLTKADLEHSQTAYADLRTSAKAYRTALSALGTAASAFGSALEACARLKEARAEAIGGPTAGMISGGGGGGASLLMGASFTTRAGSCTADALMTVAGLQHLVANHELILAETVYRSFELPLHDELDKWQAAVEYEEEAYERAVRVQSKEIKRLEKEGLKLHRQQKRRDMAKFRGHLVELTTKVDGLATLHGDHARTLLRESQDMSARIVEASCSLARAEVDIFESLARKGWTGGGLEDVLERGQDLFASEEQTTVGGGASSGGMGAHGGSVVSGGNGEGSKLFSILPPKSILADSASDVTRPGHNRADSLLMETDRYQSLAGAVTTDHAGRERDRDADSVFSEFNRSRGVIRPFSPQPQHIRTNPEDLLSGLEHGSESSAPPAGHREKPSGGSKITPKDPGHVRKQETEEEEEEHVQDSDDEEAHPWRNEGLERPEEQRLIDSSLDDSPGRQERRWAETESGLGS